jgi:hypothetical protein
VINVRVRDSIWASVSDIATMVSRSNPNMRDFLGTRSQGRRSNAALRRPLDCYRDGPEEISEKSNQCFRHVVSAFT